MYKIGIIDTINNKGIDLLKSNKNFSFEIITDLSRENLLLNLPKFDGVTLRRGKLDSGILEKCKKLKVLTLKLFSHPMPTKFPKLVVPK